MFSAVCQPAFRPLLGTSAVKRSIHLTKRCGFKIPFLPTLPQAPGGVKGDVNEAYVPPPVDKVHGSYHWDLERVISVTILPLVTIPIVTAGSLSTMTDSLLAVTAMGHFFMEFQSCITDYIPKRVYGKIHNYAMYLLYLGSLFSLVGIYKLETQENGIMGVITGLFGKTKKPLDERIDIIA